jgi:hypothetical protein
MTLFYEVAVAALLLSNSFRRIFSVEQNPTILESLLNFSVSFNSRFRFKETCNSVYNATFDSSSHNAVDIRAVQNYCPTVTSSCCSHKQLEELSGFVNVSNNLYDNLLNYKNYINESVYTYCINSIKTLMNDYVCLTCDNDKRPKPINLKVCNNITIDKWDSLLPHILKKISKIEDILKYRRYFIRLPAIIKASNLNSVQ